MGRCAGAALKRAAQMALGKSAAFGGAPREARGLADSKGGAGRRFCVAREARRRAPLTAAVRRVNVEETWSMEARSRTARMEKRARASASASRPGIDCERHQEGDRGYRCRAPWNHR
jgi:hypothetical protein